MKLREQGFTLLEVLIVVTIVAAVVGLGIPALSRKDNLNKRVMREFSVLGREIRNQSRLKNMTHRLVLNMGPKECTYWVEATQGAVLTKSKESLQEIERMREDDRPKDPFQKSAKFSKQDKVLPGKLCFGSVETESSEEQIKTGKAYVYFTPEGLVEKSVIFFTDKDKVNWSLIYNPLTGHAEIVDKEIHLKDLRVE